MKRFTRIGHASQAPLITSPTWAAASTLSAALSTAGTLAVAYPAGIAAGDRMVVQMGVRNYAGTDPPVRAGWTAAFGPQTTGNTTQILFTPAAAALGSEVGTLAWTWSVAATHNMVCATMHIFRGCSVNDLLANGLAGVIHDTSGGAASGAATGLSFTTTQSGLLLAVFGASNSGSALGTPSGWTSRDSQTSIVGNDFSLNLVTKDMTTPGAISGGAYSNQGGDPTVLRGFAIHGRYA